MNALKPDPTANPPQLTLRAILTGAILGALLTPCNIYSGLKIGWAFNMSIAAALLSYGFWKIIHHFFATKPWGILENNINQTMASAAASIISAGIVAPIPALTILTGKQFSLSILATWTFVVSFIGVMVAIGLRRQMLIKENLPFPNGIATAETISEIYSQGKEAVVKIRILLSCLIYAGGQKLVHEFIYKLPQIPLLSFFSLSAPSQLLRAGITKIQFSQLTFLLNPSLMMTGIGFIVGFRAGFSLLIGAVTGWLVLAPMALTNGWIQPLPQADAISWYSPIVKWLLWPGVTLMVVSSLFSFCLNLWDVWRTNKTNQQPDRQDHNDLARHWFWPGVLLAIFMGSLAQVYFFGIDLWIAVFAVIITFVLGIISSRVSGETGIAPVGALGKITQLTFGLLNPGNMASNLMTANVTGGAAGQSADLLHDLKTGLLIGASVWRQIIAQILGIGIGSIVGSYVYLLMIPDPANMLITPEWPAPAVATWKAVAEVFANGMSGFPAGALAAIQISALIALIMTLLERLTTAKWRPYLPSLPSVGLAFMIPAWDSISLFLGAGVALFFQKKYPQTADKFILPAAAGLVAGESLAGVISSLYRMLTS